MIDLFDFDFKNSRAGVGILVKEPTDRLKGYGREALKLLVDYSFGHLNLHQLYCHISEENEASIKLFENQVKIFFRNRPSGIGNFQQYALVKWLQNVPYSQRVLYES